MKRIICFIFGHLVHRKDIKHYKKCPRCGDKLNKDCSQRPKLIGEFLCWLHGHPQGGNVWIQGMDTYCPRCGRINLL